jgi:hypothetical protein
MGTGIELALALVVILAHPGAQAQVAGALRPERPPPRMAPLPFEGQSAPRAPAALKSAQAPAARVEGQFDAIVLVNNSTATAWVTLYRNDAIDSGMCLSPKESAKTSLGRDGGAWSLKAEFSDAKCQSRSGRICSFARPAGMATVELLGDGNQCRWQAAQLALRSSFNDRDPDKPYFCMNDYAATMAGRTSYYAWQNLVEVFNSHPTAAVWVTLYKEDWVSRTIMRSGCVAPGKSRPFCISHSGTVDRVTPFPELRRYTVEYSYDYTVRTEMQGSTCSGRVNCDTGRRIRWNWPANEDNRPGFYNVAFNANAQTCWIADNAYNGLPYR